MANDDMEKFANRPQKSGRFLRFSGQSAFGQHRDVAKKLELKHFTVLTAEAPAWQLGIVASKARIGAAVERNRTKRRLRAAMAKAIVNVKNPQAVVIYAKASVLKADFAEIVQNLEKALLSLY